MLSSCFLFFKQKTAYELRISDWSSDVCSSDLFAIQDGDVYVLEVNPRASRTVPFVSKATGLPLAKIAARAMAGKSLADQGISAEMAPSYFSVKEAVFPFVKFPGVDTILGPAMKRSEEHPYELRH